MFGLVSGRHDLSLGMVKMVFALTMMLGRVLETHGSKLWTQSDSVLLKHLEVALLNTEIKSYIYSKSTPDNVYVCPDE